ncbi:hypothetical protein [Tianweitania sediminis]|uniref:Uncharacterized protein n=1 Tax=Tianweitania sediminis TaxID=1502156 RepID=A0A8J7R040_9HYPH|nr:hypothetical protein [Tianweitania sediminis]MBP0440018.1 hypothetical protein [Tianweitania sediminis]
MNSNLLLVVACGLGLAVSAQAAETVDKEKLVAVPMEIRNSGTAPVLCQAEIAHWFAMDLAHIAPDASATLGLHFDAATGTWAAINARGEALPVERAWCGLEGRTFETRWDLHLVRDQPKAQALECSADNDRLTCR